MPGGPPKTFRPFFFVLMQTKTLLQIDFSLKGDTIFFLTTASTLQSSSNLNKVPIIAARWSVRTSGMNFVKWLVRSLGSVICKYLV